MYDIELVNERSNIKEPICPIEMKTISSLILALIFGVSIEHMIARYLLVDIDPETEISKYNGNYLF